jgi:predicted anti-sigma-YlaC factor YlaD
MACERWREMLSAQLDGEDEPGERARTEEHLVGCAGCRQWLDRAATVNRLTRTGPAVAVPDRSAAILAAVRQATADAPPGRTVAPRLATMLYAALGAVGAVQLILGLAQAGGATDTAHAHAAGLTATPGHLWHESAAWNVAVGAGFLVIAVRRNRPTGLVPMLSAFVGMLLLLSVNDLTAGRVDAARLVSHAFVIVGYLIVVTLARLTADDSRPPGEQQRTGWRMRPDDLEAATAPVPQPRLVRRGPIGPMTARHDDQRAA